MRKEIEASIVVIACAFAVLLCISAIHIDIPYESAKPIEQTSEIQTILYVEESEEESSEESSEEEIAAYYYLTPEERDTVESVVMAEAGAESRLGQMAIAQCILDGCYAEGMRPGDVVIEYQYAKSRPNPSEAVKEAVSAVFDYGEMAVADDILYFYAPKRCQSEWHEGQRFVCTIGGHKFFGKEDKP